MKLKMLIALFCSITASLAQSPNDQLVDALAQFNLEEVKQALKNGADVNLTFEGYDVPLIAWVIAINTYGINSLPLVESLIEHGARLDVKVSCDDKIMPLYEFAQYCVEKCKQNKELLDQTEKELKTDDDKALTESIEKARVMWTEIIESAEIIVAMIETALHQ